MKETTKKRITDFIVGILIGAFCVWIVAWGIIEGEEKAKEQQAKELKRQIEIRDSVNDANITINDTLKENYFRIIRPMKKRK